MAGLGQGPCIWSVVICPSTSLPLALRLDAGSPLSLSRSRARLSTGVADLPAFASSGHRLIERGSGRGSSVILAQLVARSLDTLVEGVPPTKWGRDDTPEHRREVQEGGESLPGPLAGRHRGYLTPMSDSEKSVRACQAASWFGAVQIGLESGRDLPALPGRRRTASTGTEPGGTCAGGDRGLGPGPPAFASGRPVSPSHSPARFAPVREVPPLRSARP